MLGLLHDIANHILTLSYLVEGLRADSPPPDDRAVSLELLDIEICRLLDVFSRELPDCPEPGRIEPVDLRSLASELARLASVTHRARIGLPPGPPVCVMSFSTRIWRVLSNVLDNACRAAGPGGRVDIDLMCSDQTAIIDITDDGPGFENGPPGRASLGLSVMRSLLDSCGGRYDVWSSASGGTTVRITLPSHPTGPRRRPGYQIHRPVSQLRGLSSDIHWMTL